LIECICCIKAEETHRVAYKRCESCASGSEIQLLLDGLQVHVEGNQLLSEDEQMPSEEQIAMKLILPSVPRGQERR
jgi:uncharacterized protein YacL (UPF0231 family)